MANPNLTLIRYQADYNPPFGGNALDHGVPRFINLFLVHNISKIMHLLTVQSEYIPAENPLKHASACRYPKGL